MDARELLRRYLEQRRDLGETELVLDSMSVDDALAMLGAKAGHAAPRRDPEPSGARATRLPVAPTADWREAIRAAGGAPDSPSRPRGADHEDTMPRRAAPQPSSPASDPPRQDAVHVPTTQTSQPTTSPLEDVPAGLVVGGASRALFDDPAAKLDSLAEIARVVAECRRCPLYATAINPVPGVGDPDADFMCVGEAPGANEDQQGEPFVGQAGQLLNKILAAIDLRREDVFIANVLKHRPPGNRNPLPEEVVACSPYLVRQIELVRPKVILALGTFAAQTLLETKLTIGKLRGQVHRYYGVPLIVTYHPAALLRNPSWKRPTWEDVQLARRILDRALPAGA
ncbi:MAG TPA: uracil-DNA glycosylase [Gemmatimonadaceae bacterium]|nr:uracil-DNA glycosylase [Gemmatimonadaceae bacterium]